MEMLRAPVNNGNGGKAVRVLLADDHNLVRSGLRELLTNQPHINIVAEADNGRKAVQLCQEMSADVVLMDISMPELNGIEATRQIINHSPHTKVVILSLHSNQKMVADAFQAGASGYLLKSCDFEEVQRAIRAVVANGTYLCSEIANVFLKDYLDRILNRGAAEVAVLTPREREVLQLMAEGKSTKEIAFSFNLSVKTVEAHRQRIMEKLNIHSVAELTKYAIREGITSLEN